MTGLSGIEARPAPSSLESDPVFRELKELSDGPPDRLIVFAGAGVSAESGLPCWEALVDKLIAANRFDPEDMRALERKKSGGLYPEVLELIEREMGEERFIAFIREELDDTCREVTSLAREINAMSDRLKLVITTNLDTLLEKALGWPAKWELAKGMPQLHKCVLKIHGTLEAPHTWVLTQSQYDEVRENQNWKTTLMSLYCSFHFLFVGYGLKDPNLQDILRYVQNIRGKDLSRLPIHFAILPRPQGKDEERKIEDLQRSGVKPLLYPGSHNQVREILSALSSRKLSYALDPEPEDPGSERVEARELPRIHALETCFFGHEGVALPYATMEEWHKADPEVFRSVRDERGNIIGFYYVLFLRPEALDRFVAGRLKEKEIRAADFLPPSLRDPAGEAAYFGSLCASEAWGLKVVLNALRHVEGLFREGKISKLLAWTVSPDGRELCRKIGFTGTERDPDIVEIGKDRFLESRFVRKFA